MKYMSVFSGEDQITILLKTIEEENSKELDLSVQSFDMEKIWGKTAKNGPIGSYYFFDCGFIQ